MSILRNIESMNEYVYDVYHFKASSEILIMILNKLSIKCFCHYENFSKEAKSKISPRIFFEK